MNILLTYYIYLLMAYLGLSFELSPNSIDQLGLPPGPKECPRLRIFLVFTKVFVDFGFECEYFVDRLYIFDNDILGTII